MANCGIIRMMKFQKGAIRGIQIHDEREKNKSHSNQDIDFSKSDLNYSLIDNNENTNYLKTIKERITESNLEREPRKNAVLMCQFMITASPEFFENGQGRERQKEYFEKAFNFIKEKYGEENIISANVHLDEKTPHLHVNFIPLSKDPKTNKNRLSADALFKKPDLKILQNEFYENVSKNFDLERGEIDTGRKHIEINKFKIDTKLEEQEKDLNKLEEHKQEINQEKESIFKNKKYIQEQNEILKETIYNHDKILNLNTEPTRQFDPKEFKNYHLFESNESKAKRFNNKYNQHFKKLDLFEETKNIVKKQDEEIKELKKITNGLNEENTKNIKRFSNTLRQTQEENKKIDDNSLNYNIAKTIKDFMYNIQNNVSNEIDKAVELFAKLIANWTEKQNREREYQQKLEQERKQAELEKQRKIREFEKQAIRERNKGKGMSR